MFSNLNEHAYWLDSQVEKKTLMEYSEREQKLLNARLELKTTREKMDYMGGKLSYPKFHVIHRDSSTEDLGSSSQYLYPVVTRPSQQLEPTDSQILESVFSSLMNLTGKT